MITKITAIFTAIVLAFGNFLALFVPAAPEAKTSSEFADSDYLLEKFTCSDKIYAIDEGNIKSEEMHTTVCLQGLVNRKNPCLYIINGDTYREYLEEFEAAGKTVIYKNSDGKEWTLPLLIEQFKDCITDGGYTLYRNSEYAEGLNVCCNYATAYGWLAFPTEIESIAKDAGLTLKKDFSEDTYNYSFQRKHFNELKDYFRTDAIVHVKSEKKALRDLAIQQRFWIGYSETNTAGENFLGYILGELGENTAVLGWGETEKHFVEFLSGEGCYVIPADHSTNNSYIANFTFDDIKQVHKTTDTTADKTKHYVAIEFSDGDNSQWVQNGYAEYYQKLQLEYDFPISWTFPLIQQEISPVSMRKAYQSATQNNFFIGGISGIGYMNPSEFKSSALDKYTEYTAAAALRSDMRIISILDNLPDNYLLPSFEKKLDNYTRFDNIDGGILLLDGDRYAKAGGKVWFSNDKPMLSVRLSLWYPGDEGDDVPKEWIQEQADIVNSYKADINSIDGYTLINVHPWTITIENLAYFVSLLDDDVELVTVDTMLKMISDNCPHETASPTT